MKELNRDIIENEWELAFNNAELVPSDNLWTKVELSLANAEGGTFKKRLFIFKLLAAASISFAMIVGGWQMYKGFIVPSTLPTNEIANKETIVTPKKESNKPDGEKSEGIAITEKKTANINGTIANNEQDKKDSPISEAQFHSSINKATADINSDEKSVLINVKETEKSNQLSTQSAPNELVALSANLDLEEPTIVEFKMVPWLSYVSHSKRRNKANNLWAGINMSAGNYQPNQKGGTELASATFTNEADGLNSAQGSITDEQIGRSIGVGLNVGKQMTSKFALISGFNYLQQTTTSQSNVVASNGVEKYTVSDFASAKDNSQLELTDTYEINSTYELISIPIQAGYLVLDRRFGVMILGGVANDLFLQKRVANNTSDANSTTATANDIGYSVYSISGLFGTEVSYAIGDSYSISLQPQVRQTFTSFTPNDNKPTVLEVGFKFKYIIK